MPFRQDAEQFILSVENLYDPSRHAGDWPLVSSLVSDREQTGQQMFASMTKIGQAGAALGLDLPTLLCDCAVGLAVQAIFHRALAQGWSKQYGGKIPQERAHVLVDLWAKMEASKCLLLDLGDQAESGQTGSDKTGFLGRIEVLRASLEDGLLAVTGEYTSVSSLASMASLADLGLAALRGAQFKALAQAVDRDLQDLAV